MDVDKNRWHTLRGWLFLGLLAVLSAVLGVLQYRWIGEVSRAERERLQAGLQTSLYRLRQDFNAEITAACSALLPAGVALDDADREEAYAGRFVQWKASSPHNRLFRRIALAIPQGDALVLRRLDLDKASFGRGEWPVAWTPVRERLLARLANESLANRGPIVRRTIEESVEIDLPRFYPPQPPGERRRPRVRAEADWLIVDLDIDYVRAAILPGLLELHLGGKGKLEYQSEIVLRDEPSVLIHQANGTTRIGGQADASDLMFDVQYEEILRRSGLFRGREASGAGPRPAQAITPTSRGRWQVLVRHRAGSLEAVVNQTRRRNLAVVTGVLLLMLAAVATLVRFAQRAQRLAHLEMEFVAGVSHEFRTPLSVIRTAAHNLCGGLVGNPERIKRYGTLIAAEADRLTAIVEQVLRFEGAKAGRTINVREPVPVRTLIDDSLAAMATVLDESGCVVEKQIDPELPAVFADPVALQHALQNLLANAARYASAGGWIGVSASAPKGEEGTVEIRIADRGPGIPAGELGQIFDPFYRGKKALADQIHGTGLGLNLVKRIVEAHQGTVTVLSEPGRGTEFRLRIPTAPVEQRHELADSLSRG